MNIIKLNTVIGLMKEVLQELSDERDFLESFDDIEKYKSVIYELLHNGMALNKSFQSCEIDNFLSNISNNEIMHISGAKYGPRIIMIGKLMTVMCNRIIDGYVIKSGVRNGCKTYRIERAARITE